MRGISRYRDLARTVASPETIRSIEILIAEMEARKMRCIPRAKGERVLDCQRKKPRRR
jgi:hypothetical protein